LVFKTFVENFLRPSSGILKLNLMGLHRYAVSAHPQELIPEPP